jgi:hypothetical protein
MKSNTPEIAFGWSSAALFFDYAFPQTSTYTKATGRGIYSELLAEVGNFIKQSTELQK